MLPVQKEPMLPSANSRYNKYVEPLGEDTGRFLVSNKWKYSEEQIFFVSFSAHYTTDS